MSVLQLQHDSQGLNCPSKNPLALSVHVPNSIKDRRTPFVQQALKVALQPFLLPIEFGPRRDHLEIQQGLMDVLNAEINLHGDLQLDLEVLVPPSQHVLNLTCFQDHQKLTRFFFYID